MSTIDRALFKLWDFGWLDHSEIRLSDLRKHGDVVGTYIGSADFGTSFVLPERKVEPLIHGPFRREALSPEDFTLITPEQFRTSVAAIRQPDRFYAPASDVQWEPVEKLVYDLSERSTSLFALRLTESDRALFHDWGFVLHVFREFLCVAPNGTTVDRLVFGYD